LAIFLSLVEKSMKTKPAQCAQDRRAFLKGVVAAGGATALTAVSASQFAHSPESAVQAEQPAATLPQGYRETAHVRAYYRALRD
jgi:hypothetical protein